jgi:hypothetical protein
MYFDFLSLILVRNEQFQLGIDGSENSARHTKVRASAQDSLLYSYTAL